MDSSVFFLPFNFNGLCFICMHRINPVKLINMGSINCSKRKCSYTWLQLALLALMIFISSCSHTDVVSNTESEQEWLNDIINYRHQLPDSHSDQIDSMMSISNEMRVEIYKRFSHLPMSKAAERLAEWLIDDAGHAMQYDVNSNLTPQHSFEQKRGNCLSFTMLFAALAAELGIEIKFNAVDIPNTWGLDERVGMVFYRHVNGVLVRNDRRYIFDLAMNIFDSGYPQRFISRDAALALLFNNRGIAAQADGNIAVAKHNIKLAISLSPDNPDLWANLGVILKRANKMNKAEVAFLHAFGLDQYNIPASSNLERLYKQQGQKQKALAFKKKAERARKTNPYYYYQLSLDDYREERFSSAQRAINKAIVLHNQDPRFHELKSRISQRQHKYRSAIKSLTRAYTLAANKEQQSKYLNKAELVSQRASEELTKRWERRHRANTLRESLIRD